MNPYPKTLHRFVQGDARNLGFIPDASVHLVVTSPPYWTLKEYIDSPGQLGHVKDYEEFLECLRQVWAECLRVLVPGGRLVCVVGDVCLSRREHGRHLVMPLHADICVMCRRMGFDNLNPIIWHKISNANFEVSNGTKFLGKPYEPNAIIKNDIEFILMQRKPGGYRKPTEEQRDQSRMSREEFRRMVPAILDRHRRFDQGASGAVPAGGGVSAGADVFVYGGHGAGSVFGIGDDVHCGDAVRAEQHRGGDSAGVSGDGAAAGGTGIPRPVLFRRTAIPPPAYTPISRRSLSL